MTNDKITNNRTTYLKEKEIENAVFILESSLNSLVETMVGNTERGKKDTHSQYTPKCWAEDLQFTAVQYRCCTSNGR